MATAPPPPSATRYRAASALVALHAAREALKARTANLAQAAATLVRYQMVTATLAERAVPLMLADQRLASKPVARLNPVGFTTSADQFEAMASQAEADWEFERLVESIMQETARAAQQATIVAEEKRYGWVRHLTLPSCSRCAVLAGRLYRWSDGFQRHPGCDCTMVPVEENDNSLVYDPTELAHTGEVRGLSKADTRAIVEDGADLAQIVNVRRKAAGLTESGRVLARAGRMTPEGIYRAATSRNEALRLLAQHGYLR